MTQVPDLFAQAVKKMRDAQKLYFKSRNPTDLRIAKDLEARVDQMLDASTKKIEQASLM